MRTTVPPSIPSSYGALYDSLQGALDAARLARVIQRLFTGEPPLPRLIDALQDAMRRAQGLYTTLQNTAHEAAWPHVSENLLNFLADKTRFNRISFYVLTVLGEASETDWLPEAQALLEAVENAALPPMEAHEVEMRPMTARPDALEHKVAEQAAVSTTAPFLSAYPLPPLHRDDALALLNMAQPYAAYDAASLGDALLRFAQQAVSEEESRRMALETFLQWLTQAGSAPEAVRPLLRTVWEQFPDIFREHSLSARQWTGFAAWWEQHRPEWRAAIRTALLAEDNAVLTPYHWHFLLQTLGGLDPLLRHLSTSQQAEIRRWIAALHPWQESLQTIVNQAMPMKCSSDLPWQPLVMLEVETYRQWLEGDRTPLEAYTLYFALLERFLERLWLTCVTAEAHPHLEPQWRVIQHVENDIQHLHRDLAALSQQYVREREALFQQPPRQDAQEADLAAGNPLWADEKPYDQILRRIAIMEISLEDSVPDLAESPQRQTPPSEASSRRQARIVQLAAQWNAVRDGRVTRAFFGALFACMAEREGVALPEAFTDTAVIHAILEQQLHAVEADARKQWEQALAPFSFDRLHIKIDGWRRTHLWEHLRDWLTQSTQTPKGYLMQVRIAYAHTRYTHVALVQQRNTAHQMLLLRQQALAWLQQAQQLHSYHGAPRRLPHEDGAILQLWLSGTHALTTLLAQIQTMEVQSAPSEELQGGRSAKLFRQMRDVWEAHLTAWQTFRKNWLLQSEEAALRSPWQTVFHVLEWAPQAGMLPEDAWQLLLETEGRPYRVMQQAPVVVLNWLLTTLQDNVLDPQKIRPVLTVFYLWWVLTYLQSTLQGVPLSDMENAAAQAAVVWTQQIARAAVPWQQLLTATGGRPAGNFSVWEDVGRIAQAWENLSYEEHTQLCRHWRAALMPLAREAGCDAAPPSQHTLCLLALFATALPNGYYAVQMALQAPTLDLSPARQTHYYLLAATLEQGWTWLGEWVQAHPQAWREATLAQSVSATRNHWQWTQGLPAAPANVSTEAEPALPKTPPAAQQASQVVSHNDEPASAEQTLVLHQRSVSMELHTHAFARAVDYMLRIYDMRSLSAWLRRKLFHRDAPHRVAGILPILESIHLLELEESWLGEAADPKQYAKIILESMEQQPDGAEHAAEGQGLGEIAANAHAVMAGDLPEFITEHSQICRENARLRREAEEERRQKEEERRWREESEQRQREQEEKDKKQQEENEELKRRLQILEAKLGEQPAPESKTTGPTTQSAFQNTQRHSRFHRAPSTSGNTEHFDESPRPQRFIYTSQQGSSR